MAHRNRWFTWVYLWIAWWFSMAMLNNQRVVEPSLQLGSMLRVNKRYQFRAYPEATSQSLWTWKALENRRVAFSLCLSVWCVHVLEFWTTFIWPTLKLSWFGTAHCLVRNMRELNSREREAREAGGLELHFFNPNFVQKGQSEKLLAMFTRNVHSACPMSAATDELQDWCASRFIWCESEVPGPLCTHPGFGEDLPDPLQLWRAEISTGL